MAISFVASSNNGTNGGGSVTVSKPTGLQSGDVMIAVLQGGTNSRAYPTPSGWALLQTVEDAGANYEGKIFYKIAGGSEPASYVFEGDAGGGVNSWIDIVISAFRGVDNSTPVQTASGNGSSDKIAPALATTRNNSWLICTWGYRGNVSWSAPASMASRGSSNASTITSVMLASENISVTGSTGTRTASGGGTPAIKFSAVLNPANAAPSAPTLNTPIGTVSGNVTYNWTFNDTDAGDSQSAYYLRIKRRP